MSMEPISVDGNWVKETNKKRNSNRRKLLFLISINNAIKKEII
jgi:hypothetical protein